MDEDGTLSLEDITKMAERIREIAYRPDVHSPVAGWFDASIVSDSSGVQISVTRSKYVPLHIARASAENYDLCEFSAEYAGKLNGCIDRIKNVLVFSEKEMSLQRAIGIAADAEGVQREDLCLYLMCLGLMRG